MQSSEFWKTLILATVPAIVGGGVVVGGIEFLSKDRELDIRLIEIGISILRSDPSKEEQISPAREWAIRLIEENSGQKFSSDEKRDLLVAPLKITEIEAAKVSMTDKSILAQLNCWDKYTNRNAEDIGGGVKNAPFIDDECADLMKSWNDLKSNRRLMPR